MLEQIYIPFRDKPVKMRYMWRDIERRGARYGMTCSPKTGPVTMRVRQPQTGVRRTLYGQTTLTGADRPQAPPGGGKAGRWGYGSGGGQGTQHKRSYLPSL